MRSSPSPLAVAARRGWVSAAIVAVLLVGLGLRVFPRTLTDWKGTLPGLAAVTAVLCAYALLGIWGAGRLETADPRLLRLALSFGLVAAMIYAVEIGLEYVLLPSDNTQYGFVEFGLVFLCYLAAGFIASRTTRRVSNGAMTAVAAALISSLLWYIVLLLITYSMKGTPQQASVFRAEGNMEDFARSGSANFDAWLMQDFLGAGFFHLLLGVVVGAILGCLGGLAGKALPWRQDSAKAA
jgi:hypothetical protein